MKTNTMKKSELKEFIREEIIEILSAQPIMEELDDDIEHKLSDIDPNDSVAKLASQLTDVTKEMKSVVNKWKKSEGKEKDALLKRLYTLTSIKKELEALTIGKDDIEDDIEDEEM